MPLFNVDAARELHAYRLLRAQGLDEDEAMAEIVERITPHFAEYGLTGDEEIPGRVMQLANDPVTINGNEVHIPRDWQHRLYEALATKPKPGSAMTVTAICHRSSGKSVAAAVSLFLACLSAERGQKAAFVAPFLKQARLILHEHLLALARAAEIKLDWDAANNTFTFPSGAMLMFGATEKGAMDVLRGNRFEIGMVLDEAGFMGDALAALLPTLKGGKREGWLLAVGTPQSLADPLSQLYAKGVNGVVNHISLQFGATETRLFTADEITRWEDTLAENDKKREIHADPYAGADDAVCSIPLVRAAVARNVPTGGRRAIEHHPLVFGIDPSLSANGDACIIARRQGPVVYPCIEVPVDGDAVVASTAIAKMIDRHAPDAIYMDRGGLGWPMVSMLQNWGYDITGVDFGSASPDPNFYKMRSFMWWQLREYLRNAVLPDEDVKLHEELTGPSWRRMADGNTIQVESKDAMRKRGLRSPDRADALALAVAFPAEKKLDPHLREYAERAMAYGYKPLDASVAAGGGWDEAVRLRQSAHQAAGGDYDPYAQDW